MHAEDEHLLVAGTIEDADSSALRQTAVRAPEEIMFQLDGTRLFETEHLAALRIDPGHDVPDGAVLACRAPSPEKSAATHSGSTHHEAVAGNSTPQRGLPGVSCTASSACKMASRLSATL